MAAKLKSSGSFPPGKPTGANGGATRTSDGKTVWYTVDSANPPPLTASQKAQLATLAAMTDADIDYSDIPPMTDEQLARMRPASHYRPLKRQITARLDADVLDWLKSQGTGYQSRMNAILRREMLASVKGKMGGG